MSPVQCGRRPVLALYFQGGGDLVQTDMFGAESCSYLSHLCGVGQLFKFFRSFSSVELVGLS